jgi:hypothetical protein
VVALSLALSLSEEWVEMEFRDARDTAAEVGAKLRTFDDTSPVAGCWIEFLPRAAEIGERALADAIEEANRYVR